MVSDEDLRERVWEKLKVADLQQMTERKLRQEIEEDIEEDLADRKPLIKATIAEYLNAQQAAGGANDAGNEEGGASDVEDGEEEGEEEEKGSKKRKAGKGKGFSSKLCKLSPELASFLGAEELPRTEVVKQMWVYIKGHDLQDPSNKRVIICDEAMSQLLGVESTDMFQINKLLSPHIIGAPPALGPDGQPLPKKAKVVKTKEEKAEARRRKLNGEKRETHLTKAVPISTELAAFFGQGQTEMARTEVIRGLWNYIKEHALQDPEKKQLVRCDEKLRQLLQADSFVGLEISRLVNRHFLGKSSDAS